MANNSAACVLPAYTLRPAPDLLPWISDFWLSLVLPVVIYWSISGVFVLCETYGNKDSQLSYHTEDEKLVRNTVTKREVFWVTISNQILQTGIAFVLASLQEPEVVGKEQYDIAVWACRFRQLRAALPLTLNLVGIDGKALVARFRPPQDDVLSRSDYGGGFALAPSAVELVVGQLMYYCLVPAAQFFVAFVVTDLWQYFGHRLEHEWRWLYRTVHSVHHRLYTPFVWAAFYMHPAELVFLDTVSVLLAFPIACLTAKQGMLFTAVISLKALSDHAGFHLPGNFIYTMFYANDASFHDIHHQTWGFKYNFGIYSVFWDHLFGTLWTDIDLAKRKYSITAAAAKKKVDLIKQGLSGNRFDGDVNSAAKVD